MVKFGQHPTKSRRLGLGWCQDEIALGASTRDENEVNRQELERLLLSYPAHLKRPVDLRKHFAPVRNQRSLYSSTAFACLSIVEYFENRILESICERSKAFLYAMTLATVRPSAIGKGCSIEATLKTLVRYGCPPEVLYPYKRKNCRGEPKRRDLFGFVRDFRDLRYGRLDLPDATGDDTLKITRKCLDCGIPVVFGVEVHHLMPTSGTVNTAEQLFPLSRPFYTVGWQSLVACGYDSRLKCLLVRNSWGTDWGNKTLDGYGWLPYRYLTEDHTAGFWVLYKPAWIKGNL
jgi:hypothetical protein